MRSFQIAASKRGFSATTLVVVVCSIAFGLSNVDGAARTLKVPLMRGTTPDAGSVGQPVLSYYASVGIGTPPKQFKVQFEVATNEIFVPHYSWNPFNTNLHYSNGFQCKQSSSCVKDNRQFVVWYQTCELTGKPYEDVVSLAGFYGLNSTSGPAPAGSLGNGVVFRQNFLAISSASDARFKTLPVDGFFGLGPQQVSTSSVPLDSSNGGELILGGVDTARYSGQIFWHHPTPSAGSWSLNLAQVQLGGAMVSTCNNGRLCQVSLSTGLSDTYGPRADVQRIYNILGTSHQSSGLEIIDCRRIAGLPVLVFTIDGIGYQMLPSNYVRKAAPGGLFKRETCYVSILPSAPNQDQNTWTLGTNFLGAYYTIFDNTYNQVGFAALRV